MKANSSAQGTIEYLVIIAVVVVISLVVVGLFVNMTSSPSQQIIDSSSKLGTSSSGGISVVEAVIDVAGDSLIRLNNTSSDAITLTRISVGGIDNEYSEQLVGLDSKVISLSGLSSGCVCASGQKNVNCEYIITYVQNGITKTARINKTIECVSDSTPVDTGKVVGLGSGTLADPWVINNCQELQNMNLHLDGNYVLGADINCYTDTRIGGALYNGGAGFVPVGNCDGGSCWNGTFNSFTGTFNGNNKSIYNLLINSTGVNGIGMFGYSTGAIYNVGLIDVNVIGAGYVGGLVGYQPSGTISNSHLTGSVTGSGNSVGGLAGGSTGAISICYTAGSVTGNAVVGGLVGLQSFSGTISKSYSTVSTLSSQVNAYQSNTGGLIGTASGAISNSYATGSVTSSTSGTGQSNTGGLIGSLSLSAVVTNCYSTGAVIGYLPKGLIGITYGGAIPTSYWDKTTSGRTTSAAGIGKTTAEMKTATTFSTWDSGIWNIANGAYPTLR